MYHFVCRLLLSSRTILDYAGAEHLLGQGDMLALLNGEMQRLQGYYAPYEELDRLLELLLGNTDREVR